MDPRDIRKAVVVGAGVMGSSIAQVFAQAGIEVGMVDVDEKALERAMNLIQANLDVLVEYGKVKRDDLNAIIGRVHPSLDLKLSSEGADFALEAVPEVPEVKKEVFSQLELFCPEQTVIASNTSGLDIYSFADRKSVV